MKAPDKLFLHETKLARPSWHHGRVAKGDVEYIRKDRIWKPTQEQMRVLLDALNPYYLFGDGSREIIKSLYNDLKKLVEDEI